MGLNIKKITEYEDTKDFIERIRKDFTITPRNNRANLVLPMESDVFAQVFQIIGNSKVKKWDLKKEFVIDDDNKEVINQMFYYFTMNPKFKGNFHKGILICGGFGTGKTVIMDIFTTIIQESLMVNIRKYSSLELPKLIKDKGISEFKMKPMNIDEIGREPKEINDFGTKMNPLIDLFTHRYNENSLTFGTCNFSESSMTGKDSIYGEYIGERLKEMFNFIELKGNSRRK